MSEQAILIHGPASGRIVDAELNRSGWPPDHLVVESEAQEKLPEWLKPLGPEPDIYLRTFYNWDHSKPAQDDEGRWCYQWRNPRGHASRRSPLSGRA